MANSLDMIMGETMRNKGLGGVVEKGLEGFKTGMQMAQQAEQVKMEREQLEMQKQKINQAKADKNLKFMSNIAVAKAPSVRRKLVDVYDKWMIENGGTGMSQVTKDQLVNSEDTQMTLRKALPILKQNFPNANKEQLVSMMNNFGEELGVHDSLQAVLAMGKRNDPNQDTLSYRKAKDTAQYELTLNKEVKSRFKPLQQQKQMLTDSAQNLLQIKTAIKRGEGTDKFVTQFNKSARGMAKMANSGAMTDRDVADLQNLTGASNISEDFINKWITGELNQNNVEAVVRMVGIMNRVHERAMGEQSNQIEPLFNQPLFGTKERLREVSGVEAFMSPAINESQLRELGLESMMNAPNSMANEKTSEPKKYKKAKPTTSALQTAREIFQSGQGTREQAEQHFLSTYGYEMGEEEKAIIFGQDGDARLINKQVPEMDSL